MIPVGRQSSHESTPDNCDILQGTYLKEYVPIQAEQSVAMGIAECTLLSTKNFPQGTLANTMWSSPGAMFLSDVVYPNAQLEQKLNWPLEFSNSKLETSKSMLDHRSGNWAFLEDVGNVALVLQILGTTPSGLANYPGIKWLIHEYAKNLTSGIIKDKGSPHAYTPPTQHESLNNIETLSIDVAPFRPARIEFSVDGDEYACVSVKPGAHQVSWSPGSVGSALSWSEELPKTLSGKAVFIVTSTEAGKFKIKVKKFVEDPEDCQEVVDWEGTIDGGDIDCCGSTGYLKGN
jgi:hypothetical protein